MASSSAVIKAISRTCIAFHWSPPTSQRRATCFVASTDFLYNTSGREDQTLENYIDFVNLYGLSDDGGNVGAPDHWTSRDVATKAIDVFYTDYIRISSRPRKRLDFVRDQKVPVASVLASMDFLTVVNWRPDSFAHLESSGWLGRLNQDDHAKVAEDNNVTFGESTDQTPAGKSSQLVFCLPEPPYFYVQVHVRMDEVTQAWEYAIPAPKVVTLRTMFKNVQCQTPPPSLTQTKPTSSTTIYDVGDPGDANQLPDAQSEETIDNPFAGMHLRHISISVVQYGVPSGFSPPDARQSVLGVVPSSSQANAPQFGSWRGNKSG
ncbi:hypothetical protein BDV96DRAFT_606789 [Lophiotrema nucula]|uniref:Uncharacterized protein n=1 Tax=Lophiotrema nucula TaxID=690887 RepID=A0A6A5YLW7_9PLEO|nr:hypothetical protein BDV96DRAFT_606789 [Lophiotrema nucula]